VKPCWQKVSWTFFWVFDSFFFCWGTWRFVDTRPLPSARVASGSFIFIFWNFPHRFLFFCSDDEFGSSRTLLVKKMQRLFFFRFSNSIMGSRSRVLWVGGGWDYWVSLFFYRVYLLGPVGPPVPNLKTKERRFCFYLFIYCNVWCFQDLCHEVVSL